MISEEKELNITEKAKLICDKEISGKKLSAGTVVDIDCRFHGPSGAAYKCILDDGSQVYINCDDVVLLNKRFIGYDMNKNPLYFGDEVIIHYDYTDSSVYGQGYLVASNGGWIYVKLKDSNELFPFVPQMTLDMGQMGIHALNFTYEKIG